MTDDLARAKAILRGPGNLGFVQAEVEVVLTALDEAEARADQMQRDRAALSDALNGTPCAEIRWQEQIASLTASRDAAIRERDEAREELATWRSVFPDIAPDSVLPDRSNVEASRDALASVLRQARAAMDRIANHPEKFDDGRTSYAVGFAFYAVQSIARTALIAIDAALNKK